MLHILEELQRASAEDIIREQGWFRRGISTSAEAEGMSRGLHPFLNAWRAKARRPHSSPALQGGQPSQSEGVGPGVDANARWQRVQVLQGQRGV